MKRELLTHCLLSVIVMGGVGNLCHAQDPDGYQRLMQGPMVGAPGPNSARIWCRASGENTLRLEVSSDRTMQNSMKGPEVTASAAHDYCVVLTIDGLQPDTPYHYRVLVDGKIGKYQRDCQPFTFKTAPKGPARFRVSFGSCARYQYDRVQPIWCVLDEYDPDLFFWLGDNIYGDSPNPQILAEEYRRNRDVANLQPILHRIPHLAVWDDHDYGLNNHDASHPWKAAALAVFKDYWPNPSYGLPETPGVFFKYAYGGVDFFFLDNRYNRSPNEMADGPEKLHLGKAQRQWLLEGLSTSTALFKVLVIGGGWNSGRGPTGDSWSAFNHARQSLFREIFERKIEGVLLFSGDTHFGELNRIPGKLYGGYDLYELVSSPLAQEPDADAPELRYGEQRVRDSYHLAPHAAIVDFDLTQSDPCVTLNLVSIYGRTVWKPLTIKASMLRVQPPSGNQNNE
jgi:alkaline phosphatase D